MKKLLKFSLSFMAIALLWSACSDESVAPKSGTGTDTNAKKATAYDVPTLTCAGSTQVSIYLTVTAGATGAPAGFTIQWMTAADYAASGWNVDSLVCRASFSGNANLSRYNLGSGGAVTVNIGEMLYDNGASSTTCGANALLCGTDYVFRIFAHANSSMNRSAFSSNTTCSTLACSHNEGCTYTQGYWKTHGPVGCASGNNTNEWPVSSLTLGTVNYTDLQLCAILSTPAQGNGLTALAHQLIAAKLNIAGGSSDTDAAAAVAAADALIGGKVVPSVGTGSLAPSATSSWTFALTNYNEGLTGPGHCD